MGVKNVEVEVPPTNLEVEFKILLTSGAVEFIAAMASKFNPKVDEILSNRTIKKLGLDEGEKLPDFPIETQYIREMEWTCAPLPPRLRKRHVDLGDVSPANTNHFERSLQSNAQGVQTDFDDGHCPSWPNQLLGHYNVYRAVHGEIPGVPSIANAPILMLRPRAWNMTEHNILVDGRKIPGPLFDFALLTYHNAKLLWESGSGPFFYLSKVESYMEARLWNELFIWSQSKLGLPRGTIKATVLIENVLAAFEMHEILYELREHSAGLNCGIWDYSASFINKFGGRREFILPDRSKYVNMQRHFLKSYMDLVIQTCHQRGTLATGGMSALLLPKTEENTNGYHAVLERVAREKLQEIEAGVDGFMVFDLGLIHPMQQLFARFAPTDNQLHVKRENVNVTRKDLLEMPSGGVTLEGLKHNVSVGILFIEAWLRGKGHFFYKGRVEDSATAEISRSQVWQWLRHCTTLENSDKVVSRHLIRKLISEFISDTLANSDFQANPQQQLPLVTAATIFEEVVTQRYFTQFITTYLSEAHEMQKQKSLPHPLVSKL
ncbi:PREDICTED: malate synthase-like [Priapulus caudatus]|uniref:malate synthase n=1 Tax=Priapulus caudatus TaxID=37621 RepID=A0ABM1FBX0_PRICU|nr:PREDICTED: malate synthase-like [Priapulus caudatus]